MPGGSCHIGEVQGFQYLLVHSVGLKLAGEEGGSGDLLEWRGKEGEGVWRSQRAQQGGAFPSTA